MDPEYDDIDRIHFDDDDGPGTLKKAVLHLKTTLELMDDARVLTDDEEDIRADAWDSLDDLYDWLDRRHSVERLDDVDTDHIARQLESVENDAADVVNLTNDIADAIDRLEEPDSNPNKLGKMTATDAKDNRQALRRFTDIDDPRDESDDDSEPLSNLFG